MRNPALTLAMMLTVPGVTTAQDAAMQLFADADREQNWQEHFDGKTLKDWQAAGAVEIKDGLLVLGGPPTTILRLQKPLGPKFKILIECKVDGPISPNLHLVTRSFLSRGASGGSLNLKPGEWTELLLVGAPNQHGSLVLDKFTRTVADKKAMTDGQFGGRGEPSIQLEVPPGGKLTIRRIRLETVPQSGVTSYLAIGILVLVLLSVIVAGWMVRRRKSTNAVG